MSNDDYVVGRAYGEMAPNQSSIYEALLERAQRENEEQARLLGRGSEREARLITERDHYKQALEEISTTIQEYKDSMIQEPAEDFIWAIKAWADKKLKEI
jgi:hypothetical protein